MKILASLIALLLAGADTPDEIMEKELKLISQRGGPSLILNAMSLQPHLTFTYNPAIVQAGEGGRVILSFRGQRWKDINNYFVFGGTTADLNTSLPHKYNALHHVEDIRMLPSRVNMSDVYLVFTQVTLAASNGKTYGHMSMATMRTAEGVDEADRIRDVLHLNWSTQHAHGVASQIIEKNWSPFHDRSDRLNFVYSLRPLTVLNISRIDSARREAILSVVSVERCPGLSQWRYGSPRGGTPWQEVGGVLLSFFHSRSKLQGSPVGTYWMGAITMTPEAPFRLLKMSSQPILLDEWYKGSWSGFGPVDYILYPMGFFVAGNGTLLTLSLGRNDNEGLVVQINTDMLMRTLVPLSCNQTQV